MRMNEQYEVNLPSPKKSPIFGGGDKIILARDEEDEKVGGPSSEKVGAPGEKAREDVGTKADVEEYEESGEVAVDSEDGEDVEVVLDDVKSSQS